MVLDVDGNVVIAVLALAGTVISSLVGASVLARNKTLEVQQQSREIYQHERDVDRQRIKDLEERDADWERRCNALWLAREADALVKRVQGDHIDVLEAHIWGEKPPPPPPRPTLA